MFALISHFDQLTSTFLGFRTADSVQRDIARNIGLGNHRFTIVRIDRIALLIIVHSDNVFVQRFTFWFDFFDPIRLGIIDIGKKLKVEKLMVRWRSKKSFLPLFVVLISCKYIEDSIRK